MFRPVRMEKLTVLLLGADARAALLRLGGEGTLELIPAAEGPDTVPLPPRDNKAALALCRELLSRLEELRRALGQAAVTGAGAEPVPFGDCAAALAAIGEDAAPWLERRAAAAKAAAAAALRRGKLLPYASLPLSLERLRGSAFLRCFTGAVPSINFKSLAAARGNWLLWALSESGGRTLLIALAHRGSAPALEAALKAAGFSQEEPPAAPGLTLEEAAAHYAGEEKKAGQEAALAERSLAELAAAQAGKLAGIERAVRLEAGLLEAERCLPRSAASVLLSGWAPAAEAGNLRRELRAATEGRCAAESAPAEGGAPVLLRPPGLFAPFAGLVRAYGLPGYGETDPTVFAAVLYVLIFGAMFGDAGHGAVVCAGGLWFALKGRGAVRDAGRMAASCGLSAMVFGLVYGSFFGLESFKKYALWRDPLDGDPFALVLAAMAAGAAIISLGVALNIGNRLAAGDRIGAALGRYGAAGLAFYWCAILMLAGKIEPGSGVPVMGAALACWLLEEPLRSLREGGKVGALETAAGSVVGAFEGALLYLANTVSFARVAAYAMSHAALLAAAYMLAEAADKTWGAGSAAGWAAVIAGNAAAIALEGIVAAVQTLRLEYYEFFGKFFTGGGRPFTPFALKTAGGIK